MPQVFDAADADHALSDLAQQFEEADLSDALRDCLPILHEGIEDNFMAARGPTGSPWLPRKNKKTRWPLLIHYGHLIEAARDTGGRGHIDRVGPRELVTGVDGGVIDYAPIHQYGGGRVPARPFMYADDKTQEKLAEVFMESAFKIILGG